MRPGSLGYLIGQGWHNMAANRLMSFASIAVLTACLIITGIASLLSANVNRIVDYLADQNEIVVYLKTDLSEEDTAAIEEQIKGMSNILEVKYESKADALDTMKEWMAEYSGVLDSYKDIFPARFFVSVEDLHFISETNQRLLEIEGVESTNVPTDLAGIMITLKNAVTYGGWALVIVLAVVSIIVISNTIRLTVFARRREISIMKYVGATNTFIRLPFFVEGMTVGAVAGAIAAALVCVAYYFVYQYLLEMYNTWVMSLMSQIYHLQDIWPVIVIAFVAFGIIIGGFGSATSVRRHLKV